MADIDEKVMAFVKETVEKSPKVSLDELFERAKKISSDVAELSKRQFNARYPLQVKRRLAQASHKKSGATRGRGRKASAAKAEASRAAVRQVLLRFATDLAGADDRKDLVEIVAGVDRYVDQVFKGIEKA